MHAGLIKAWRKRTTCLLIRAGGKNMAHLKRLGIPKNWPMPRKGSKFAVRPSSGPHAIMECMPLRVILRDVLGYADNAKESMHILSQGMVLVDKKPRKRSRFPVGLMDVIEIPAAKKYFRMVTGKAGLVLEKMDESQASFKTWASSSSISMTGGTSRSRRMSTGWATP
jgi:small subunit ribosomal protein S4e